MTEQAATSTIETKAMEIALKLAREQGYRAGYRKGVLNTLQVPEGAKYAFALRLQQEGILRKDDV